MKWAEISDRSETIRLTTLSSALNKFGLSNELTFIEANPATLPDVLKQAKRDFDQIRISGSLSAAVTAIVENFTMLPHQIGAADALVRSNGSWWPRNFLAEGLHRALVNDVPNLDMGASVFILGTNWQAAAAVSALSKAGFKSFTIAATDSGSGKSFVDRLRRTYFEVRFELVDRQAITQLPSIHSVAINTLERGEDEGCRDELIYFNFLKLGGVWLDLPLVSLKGAPGDSLAEEADAAGAFVESPVKVVAAVDRAWAEACIEPSTSFKFDRNAYRSLLSKALKA